MNLKLIEKTLASRPKFRLTQAQKAIFKELVSDWSQVTVFPKELRDKLNIVCPITIDSRVYVSLDGRTVKALLTMQDDENIETVLMKHKERNTICVSTQVGCPLNCSFCATGKMGFKRNLEIGEIVEQVLFFGRYLKAKKEKVTNIVFMGMGEPFLNYDNVLGAIRYLNQKDGFNLGARHISISTSGIPDKIRKFAKEDIEVNLALSLHSADDSTRTKLMPVNKAYPLQRVLDALTYYQDKTHRKIMFEYIMIAGINDSEADARKLIELTKKYTCLINLIPYNSSQNSIYKVSTTERIAKFKKILESARVNVLQRFSYGRDIDAACGQLANKAHKKNRELQTDPK